MSQSSDTPLHSTSDEGRPRLQMPRTSRFDRGFDVVNVIFMIVVVIAVGYPLLFVMSASISDPSAVGDGDMWLWPVDITLDGFRKVFSYTAIWNGYKNTIIYTLSGVALHLVILLPAAYALSRKELMAKTLIVWVILFTMLFNGGLIPTYLVIKQLGMLNTIWAIIVPNVVGAWAILVARAFFKVNIPEQLTESAKIDGASDFSIFVRIAIPLSAPIIATMALFHGVGLWNQYFGALIYLHDESKYPLQLILRQILVINQIGENASTQSTEAGSVESLAEQIKTAELIKYAVMIVAALPLLIVYPFIQRFFVKGVLIGSVKE